MFMQEYFLNLIKSSVSQQSDLNLQLVIWSILWSTVLSYILALIYRLTYQGELYSRNFAHSMILMGVLVSIIIALIGGNIARAFGVVGALSIIRFRINLRDPKDISYIFSSIVIGMACGTGSYFEAAIATVLLAILIVILFHFGLGLSPLQTIALKIVITEKEGPVTSIVADLRQQISELSKIKPNVRTTSNGKKTELTIELTPDNDEAFHEFVAKTRNSPLIKEIRVKHS